LPIPKFESVISPDPEVHPSGAGVYKARPNATFFYVHNFENWDVESAGLDGAYLLPQLHRSWVIPGVNLHHTPKRGEAFSRVYADAHNRMKEQGTAVIPQDVVCDGVQGYIRRMDCKHPKTGASGKLHMDRFERPRPARKGKRVKFERDRAAYNRWRYHLVAEGHIAPPDEDIIEEKIGRAEYHRDRNKLKMKLPKEVREELVAQATEKVEALLTAEIPPEIEKPKRKPATRKRRARKATTRKPSSTNAKG